MQINTCNFNRRTCTLLFILSDDGIQEVLIRRMQSNQFSDQDTQLSFDDDCSYTVVCLQEANAWLERPIRKDIRD